MANWKDTTSYEQGDKRRIPRSYKAVATPGYLNLVVSRHIHDPGWWILRTNVPGLDMARLHEGDDVEIAKRNALKLVENRLAELVQVLEALE
jgi:hypothetical protein